MPKTIVTHLRPDLDACTSVWLIKRYYPNFSEAQVVFLPAGNTYQNKPADTDKNVIHVDTGMGKFDHHQFRERLSASLRIVQYLTKSLQLKSFERQALKRLAESVTFIDNFQDANLENPDSDIYEMFISQLLEGVKMQEPSDECVVELTLPFLDGWLAILKRKILSEKELEKGEEFYVDGVKCLSLNSNSKEACKLAQKQGYQLVILRHPQLKNVNLRVHPSAKFNLDKVYQAIIKKEKKNYWFYHASGKMLLNGSNSHPQPPTRLSLAELTNIVKKYLLK